MSANNSQRPSLSKTPNNSPENNPDAIGFGLAIGGATLFATKSIFAKLAYLEGGTTETVLAMRMAVAVPVYVLILAFTLFRAPQLMQKLTLRNVLGAMGVGALGYWVASYLNFMGLNFISAQLERLVLYIYPFLTVGLGIAFFGHKMKKGIIPAMLVSWIGLAVIFGWNLSVQSDGLMLGTAFVLGSAFFFALFQLLAKGQMAKIGTTLFTCIGMTFAGAIALTHNTIANGIDSLASLTPKLWMLGLGLGIISTVLPSFMINAAIHRVGARVTSASGTLGPIMTIILAVTILGEPFTWFHGFGAALVIFGAILFSRAEQQQR